MGSYFFHLIYVKTNHMCSAGFSMFVGGCKILCETYGLKSRRFDTLVEGFYFDNIEETVYFSSAVFNIFRDLD